MEMGEKLNYTILGISLILILHGGAGLIALKF